MPADPQGAFATLYVTLVTLARLLATVLPFLAEALYQNLVRGVDPAAPASVHLTGYPETREERRTTNDEGSTQNSDHSSFVLRLMLQSCYLEWLLFAMSLAWGGWRARAPGCACASRLGACWWLCRARRSARL
jgi:hypothetical protein